MIAVENLSVRYGELVIVDDVSFAVEENQWLMIVGPNGAGKSTLIKAIAKGAPYTGAVTLLGSNLASVKPSWLAKRLGVLAQHNPVAYAFSVREIVKLGRYTWNRGLFSASSDEDEAMIDRALEATGLVISGVSPDSRLVEYVELPEEIHPYFVATQSHPELKSRPTRPHPLFAGLIEAALARKQS